MPFQGWGEGVKPVRRADEVFQGLGRSDIFDPQWNHRDSFVYCAFHLELNLSRGIGVSRKDEHHGARAVDGFDDGAAPILSWQNVARGNPATNTMRLQHCTNSIRSHLIFPLAECLTEERDGAVRFFLREDQRRQEADDQVPGG